MSFDARPEAFQGGIGGRAGRTCAFLAISSAKPVDTNLFSVSMQRRLKPAVPTFFAMSRTSVFSTS